VSTFITTIEDGVREAGIRTWGALFQARTRMEDMREEQRGQVSVEYLGMLFVIAVIVYALTRAGLGNKIRDAINGLVDSVAGGGKEPPK
jgi:hypothetical protein